MNPRDLKVLDDTTPVEPLVSDIPMNPQLSDKTKRPRNTGTWRQAVSKASIRKLEQLGFDPLERMIECHKAIREEIDRQKRIREDNDNGVKKVDLHGKTSKYSAMAHTNLLALEQKLLSDLLPYRYAKIPTDSGNGEKVLPPILISLTKKGDVYEINPDNNVDINEQTSLAYKGDDE